MFFMVWKTAWKTVLSSENLTSNFAGCTLTSTLLGSISKFKIKKANFPIGIIPLYACSAAAVRVLSFIYLSFTKNIWFDLLERAIAGFPITPFTLMFSYSYSTGIISSAISFP